MGTQLPTSNGLFSLSPRYLRLSRNSCENRIQFTLENEPQQTLDMDKIEGYKQQLEKDLADDSKPWTKYLKLAEEKTGVSRLYIFLGESSNVQYQVIVCVQVKDKYGNNAIDTTIAIWEVIGGL